MSRAAMLAIGLMGIPGMRLPALRGGSEPFRGPLLCCRCGQRWRGGKYCACGHRARAPRGKPSCCELLREEKP